MNLASLFITLGINGHSPTVKAIKGVHGALSETKNMAIETQVKIAAAVYGLQQMMAKSGNAGLALQQFSSATDLSIESLQKWQYAARQYNVGADEMEKSTKSVQDAMTNMILGKGAPEGLGLMANTVGFDPKKARDTFYVMQQLQKFILKAPADVAKNLAMSFGISEGVFAAMKRGAFNAKAFGQADIYNPKEAENLRRIQAQWQNLGDVIAKSFGHLNAKYGLDLVNWIVNMYTKVYKLIDALTLFLEKIGAFKAAFTGFKAIEGVLNNVLASFDRINADKKGVAEGTKKEALRVVDSAKEFGGKAMDKIAEYTKRDGPLGFVNLATDKLREVVGAPPQISRAEQLRNLAVPETKPFGFGYGVPQTEPDMNVSQTLIFNQDVNDHKKTSDTVKKAIGPVYRQMVGQGQGS